MKRNRTMRKRMEEKKRSNKKKMKKQRNRSFSIMGVIIF